MPVDSVSPVSHSIGVRSNQVEPIHTGAGLKEQIAELLTEALIDLTVLEVRSFESSEEDEDSVPSDGGPLTGSARLRALTRVRIDGDTEQCIPTLASGKPDEALWALHRQTVVEAREDRARILALVISALDKLV